MRPPAAGPSRIAITASSRWRRMRIYSELPPGPPLPTALQTLLAWRHTVGFLAAARRRYGPIYTIRVMPWGRIVVISDAYPIKQVFTGDAATFHAGEGNAPLAPILGKRSVLVLDEDEHLRSRKRLLSPFHREVVRSYEQIVEEVVIEQIERWPIGKPFPLHPRMRAITLEVILKALIGVSDRERLSALREALPASASVTPAMVAMSVFPKLGRVGRWRRYRHTLAHASSLLRSEISERRRDPSLAEREDVLSQLVRTGESDDEELRDQVITLALAGYETSATGLAWSFERLLRHPESHARACVGDEAYLDAVVQETLRVRPVIPVVLRQLGTPAWLGDHNLPAGITVMPAIALMHGDPTLFPEPERFRPERFLEGNAGSTYTWIPFGGGRRRCLGAAFASSQMRVALRTILERTVLQADKPASEKIRNQHFTLVPARGARVVRQA